MFADYAYLTEEELTAEEYYAWLDDEEIEVESPDIELELDPEIPF